MTGRYIRKTVPLEVRGISRGIESHPPPEFEYFHQGYTEYPDSGRSDGVGSFSGRSSSYNADLEINNSSLTTSFGWTTERTSSISTFEDEIDRQATKDVRFMFENIDSVLFENTSGSKHLQGECMEWVNTFPHLRILGQGISDCPQDLGFHMVPREMCSDSSDLQMQDLTQSLSSLTIQGTQVDVVTPRNESSLCLSDKKEGEFNVLDEEIIYQDGLFEDIIAVDVNNDDVGSSWMKYKRKAFPPVTPQACVKDNISGAVFDFIWTEFISWLRQLLDQYAHFQARVSKDETVGRVKLQNNAMHLLSLNPAMQSMIEPPSRENTQMSSRPLDNHKRSPTNTGLSKQQLDGIMKISSIIPQKREMSFQEPMDSARPMSSYARQGERPVSVKATDPLPRNSSARNRFIRPGTNRLAPIDKSSKAPTANNDDRHPILQSVLVGRSVLASNSRISSPFAFNKTGPLPPIGKYDNTENNVFPRKRFLLRASSAVHDKETRVLIREKTVVPLETRPSTSQPLYNRSDTPGFPGARRSSTPSSPQWYNNFKVAHASAGAIGNLGSSSHTRLNVTGSSINPINEVGPHRESPEGPEQLDDILESSETWGGSSLHPQIRRAKQQHCNMPVR